MKDAKTLLATQLRQEKVNAIAKLLARKLEYQQQCKQKLAEIDEEIKRIEKSK